MGISDWVWGTYINSSLTLLCVCWLVAWPHFIHSVRPESNKITLAEINWWLWRSFSRAVTFPNRSNVHSHFTLWSASFVEVREEAGFEVFSSLSLCSFIFYSRLDWTVSVTFHASAKLWMPSRRDWTCELLSTYLNHIASPFCDCLHFTLPSLSLHFFGGNGFAHNPLEHRFLLICELGIKSESRNKQSDSQICSKHTNLRSVWSRSWCFVQTSIANSRCKFPFGDFIEIISPNILQRVVFWPSALIISTNPWCLWPSGAEKKPFQNHLSSQSGSKHTIAAWLIRYRPRIQTWMRLCSLMFVQALQIPLSLCLHPSCRQFVWEQIISFNFSCTSIYHNVPLQNQRWRLWAHKSRWGRRQFSRACWSVGVLD